MLRASQGIVRSKHKFMSSRTARVRRDVALSMLGRFLVDGGNSVQALGGGIERRGSWEVGVLARVAAWTQA